MSTGRTERLFATTNLDPALAEAVEAAPADRILEGIIRLEDPSEVPAGFRVVSRFHRICTGRFAAGLTWTIRRHPNVISFKASRPLGLHDDGLRAVDPFDNQGWTRAANERLPFTGRGCIVAALDFGLDFAHHLPAATIGVACATLERGAQLNIIECDDSMFGKFIGDHLGCHSLFPIG